MSLYAVFSDAHPFLRLQKDEQNLICNALQQNERQLFSNAFQHMRDDSLESSADVISLVEHLNEKAAVLCKHSFLLLQLADKTNVLKTYQQESNLQLKEVTSKLSSIVSIMRGTKVATHEEQQIVERWDQLAQEVLNTGSENQKKHLGDRFQNLTGFVTYGKWMSGMSGVSSACLALLYCRSSKVLALASLCATCASFALYRTFCASSVTCQTLLEKMQQCDKGLSKSIHASYEVLGNTNWIAGRYLNAHKTKIALENPGPTLLQEQLDATGYLSTIIQRLKLAQGTCLEQAPSSESIKLPELKQFFEKFGSFCQQGALRAAGFGCAALAWAYYSYMQRARLMCVIGVVYGVSSMVIAQQLYTLGKGSKAISVAQNIETQFQEVAKRSFLLRRMGMAQASATQIQNRFVVPFDAILKLIPAWKEVAVK